MKKTLAGISTIFLGICIAIAIMAGRFESKIIPNAFVGPVAVGGLSKQGAAVKLETWWVGESLLPIAVTIDNKRTRISLQDLGVTLDASASVEKLPMTDLWDNTKESVGARANPTHFPVDIRLNENAPKLQSFVQAHAPKGDVARVFYANGSFERVPERPADGLDEKAFTARIAESLDSRLKEVQVPFVPMPNHVSDQQLDEIDEVVSTFTTKFPTRKKDRNTNIRIASSKIDGTVLLPGELFSFNGVVGRRTIRDGYKEAPVFANGKHDMGVGGGICQVSSTLYNAALFGDIQIVQRHNHSMPVAYLPVGRDATVDYGSLDLKLRNNLATPIAISAEYVPGKLTFRILGKKNPGLRIEVASSDLQSWNPPTKTVSNASLPVGTKKVLEKGSRGHSIKTFRVVYRDGVEIAREPLGRSYYKGGERVVEVGTKPIPTASAVLPAPVKL